MAQFDVYRNPDPATVGRVPFLVDLQTEFLDGLTTHVFAPLVQRDRMVRSSHLNPIVEIEGRDFVLATAELAAAPRRGLGEPIATLADRRDDIVAALDFLFTGI